MKVKRKENSNLGPWDMAALVIAGLLFLDFLSFLILLIEAEAAKSVSRNRVYALEMGVVTGVLLLIGIALYYLGKHRRLQTFWRRMLLGSIFAGGSMMVFFGVAVIALIAFSSNL